MRDGIQCGMQSSAGLPVNQPGFTTGGDTQFNFFLRLLYNKQLETKHIYIALIGKGAKKNGKSVIFCQTPHRPRKNLLIIFFENEP